MKPVELFPSLDRCIESTARDEFCKSVSRYMEGGRQDKELEKRIELLRAFLEGADFRKLRSQSEKHLLAHEKVRFVRSKQRPARQSPLLCPLNPNR